MRLRLIAAALCTACVVSPVRSSIAQGTPAAAPCNETRSVLTAPVVNTTSVQLGWTPASRHLIADTDTRVEALAVGNQCIERDLRDPAIQLRRQGALTRDSPFARSPERASDGAHAGVWLRGRTDIRVDPEGGHAAAYDLAVGAWKDLGPFTFTTQVQDVETAVSLSRFARGSAPVCDTECVASQPLGAQLATQRARELVLTATTSWRRVGFDMSAGAGLSTFDGPRRWAVGQAALPVGERLDVVMLARTSSRQISPSGHEIGAMLRYHLGRASVSSGMPAVAVPTVFRAEPTGREDVYRLVIRVERARTVEVRADFTDWQPVALAPVGNGDWWLTLRVPPGLHQVLMRVDGGEWNAPPGLPVAPDGFGERVGMLRTGR
jgi:hypothetical protein